MEGTLQDIRPILAATPERWQRLAETLPPALLERQPKAGEWSARECLLHMLDTEGLNTYRVGCFLAGKDFAAFDPDEARHKTQETTPELVGRFASLRAETLKLLARLSAADLERGARHGGLGPVTLRQLLNNWAAHDLNHTVQAERALMQPFIDACGPWQVYYADHWVGAR